MQFRLGAHIGLKKDLLGVLVKAQQLDANCIQIFSSPPTAFFPSKFSLDDRIIFKKQAIVSDIGPNFIHAKYLINLGTDKEGLRHLSEKCLIDDLHCASEMGMRGVIVHTGSHQNRGFETVVGEVVRSIKKILQDSPDDAMLYLEIAAGGGGKIGSTFEELAVIIDEVESERIGICLDSAHLFAAGFAFDTVEKAYNLAKLIQKTVGWKRVGCIHVNDSKVPFASHKDRHENLGEGEIGLNSLKNILTHPKFSSLPLILETPGFDGKGPDKKNMNLLKSMVNANGII